MYAIGAVVFALVVVMFTMKMQLGNSLLEFAGKHLFGLYIMQRLPMALLQHTAIGANAYVYAVVCFLLMYWWGLGLAGFARWWMRNYWGRFFHRLCRLQSQKAL